MLGVPVGVADLVGVTDGVTVFEAVILPVFVGDLVLVPV